MGKSTDLNQNHELQIKKIQAAFGSNVVIDRDSVDCPILWVKNPDAIKVLGFLKNTEGLEYVFLSDLTAYDELGSDEEKLSRFVVVYNLFSPQFKSRMRVKIRVAEGEPVESAISLWTGANWAEREVYDMFGIKISNHPDLRRILMDQRWVGHPLRKDYYWRKYQLFTDAEPIPMHLLEKKD